MFAVMLAALLTSSLLWPVRAAEGGKIPNFAPDSITGWLKRPGDEFIVPASGPGPVEADPSRPYVSNALAPQETVKIADISNPILLPWVAADRKSVV